MISRFLSCLGLAAVLAAPAGAAGIVAATPPPAIVQDLSRASAITAQVAACAATEKKPGPWAELAQTSRAQTDAVRSRAESLFGGIDLLATQPLTANCRRWSRGDARQDVAELAQSVDHGLKAIAAEMRQGVWLGLFPLCADTVAESSSAALPQSQWAVTVRLKPAAAALLTSYSARFVRPEKPPPMSLRVQAREIAAPLVLEPTGPDIVLTWTGDQKSHDGVMQGLAGACPAGLKLSPTP